MDIDKRLNGHDLESDDLFIASDGTKSDFEILARPRIGVDYSGSWAKELLRFYIKDNRFVSRR
jgi:DNA-3-methyladenine glycosylase